MKILSILIAENDEFIIKELSDLLQLAFGRDFYEERTHFVRSYLTFKDEVRNNEIIVDEVQYSLLDHNLDDGTTGRDFHDYYFLTGNDALEFGISATPQIQKYIPEELRVGKRNIPYLINDLAMGRYSALLSSAEATNLL